MEFTLYSAENSTILKILKVHDGFYPEQQWRVLFIINAIYYLTTLSVRLHPLFEVCWCSEYENENRPNICVVIFCLQAHQK